MKNILLALACTLLGCKAPLTTNIPVPVATIQNANTGNNPNIPTTQDFYMYFDGIGYDAFNDNYIQGYNTQNIPLLSKARNFGANQRVSALTFKSSSQLPAFALPILDECGITPNASYRYAITHLNGSFAVNVPIETTLNRFVVPMCVYPIGVSSTDYFCKWGTSQHDWSGQMVSTSNPTSNNIRWTTAETLTEKDDYYIINVVSATAYANFKPWTLDMFGVFTASTSPTFTANYIGLNRPYYFMSGDGFNQSRLDEAYNSGYEQGVLDTETTNGQINGVFGLFASAFDSASKILSIRLFGFITLGSLLAVPLIVGIVWAVIKLIRG